MTYVRESLRSNFYELCREVQGDIARGVVIPLHFVDDAAFSPNVAAFQIHEQQFKFEIERMKWRGPSLAVLMRRNLERLMKELQQKRREAKGIMPWMGKRAARRQRGRHRAMIKARVTALIKKWRQEGFTAKNAFINLWEKINGAASWKENPWVWVVEFKRLEGSAIGFAAGRVG